jgi:MATE family multidrug resistance protein
MQTSAQRNSGFYDFLLRFFRLSSVSILSNMMVPLAGLVDTAFLGHLDQVRFLAGVILGSILFDYLYRVLKFLRSSTNAMTAQAAGREDPKAVLLAGMRSGLVALVIGVVIILLQYPIQSLGFTILSGTDVVEAAGADYFYGRVWGAPAVLLNFVLIGWFLGQEKNGMVLAMAIVGNGSNVLLDYLMIVQWGWQSFGAGLATAVSQGLALLVALFGVMRLVYWPAVSEAIAEFWDRAALRETITLKGNLLIRFLVLISTYAIFTNLSAVLGTTVLVQNGILLQIALFSQFTIQGVGMTTQTLIGNFKSKDDGARLLPVLLVSLATALLIALGIALITIRFPAPIFGLLTSQAAITAQLADYAIWLLPLLGITAIAFMLEGYFIGLKAGAELRNAVLLAFGVGFLPLAIAAGWLANNHLLWLALVGYVFGLAIALAVQLPATFVPLSPKPVPEQAS